MSTEESLTHADLGFLMALRHRGFAICVFSPEELRSGKCSRRTMEDFLAGEGNELLALETGTEEEGEEDE
jgi:hypothetical protein